MKAKGASPSIGFRTPPPKTNTPPQQANKLKFLNSFENTVVAIKIALHTKLINMHISGLDQRLMSCSLEIFLH